VKFLRFALISLVCAGTGVAGVDPDFSRPTSTYSVVANEVVNAHNAVRSKVGVPPLAWSDELAGVAQRWAQKLLAADAFEHSNNDYGENLYRINGPGASSTPMEVVNAWAAEHVYYRYANNSCTGICGHYTQVVWKDTKAVGCGSARDAEHEVWVCNYAPYGNIVGERPY
jgi:pathogenesis-related protein 1